MTKKKTPNKGLTNYLSTMPLWDVDSIVAVLRQSPGWESVLPQEEVVEKIYPDDPVAFMRDVLGYKIWSKIEEICYSVRDNHNTVVSSSYGTGKSVAAASLACWWMCVKKPAMVITLAPTFSQVQSIIWAYIRTVAKRAQLPGIVLETPRWKINEDQIAYGLSPRKGTDVDMASLAGRHSENLLVIMDEGSGLPKIVWDTVEGLAVGENNRIICISNPIDQSGPLWSAMNNPNWHPITISSFDHPNVIEGAEIIPGAVTRSWVESRCNDWAYDVEPYAPDAVEIPWCNRWVKPLPIFKAKVMGQAPEMAEDQLISLAWVKLAQESEGAVGSVIIGLDPARSGGDDSAVCIREGMQVLAVQRRKNQDSNKLAAWMQQLANEYPKLEKIYIDEIGIGAGAVDACIKLGLPAVGVTWSRGAVRKTQYVNLRAECWWNLREALRLNKISLPYDPQLEGDLTTPKYSYDNYGRIIIESKEDLRVRLGRSPDSGDALALTFALPWHDEDYLTVKANQELSTKGEWRGSRWRMSENLTTGRWRR